MTDLAPMAVSLRPYLPQYPDADLPGADSFFYWEKGSFGLKRRGFYLITLKGSQQDGLTGAKGSVVRKVVVDKTRSSLESALASIKQTVEHSAPDSAR